MQHIKHVSRPIPAKAHLLPDDHPEVTKDNKPQSGPDLLSLIEFHLDAILAPIVDLF